MAEPQKGVAYEFYLSVADLGDSQMFVVDPTIAAGDFQVSKDGGAFANLSSLPTVAPGGSQTIKINLSTAEMTADKVDPQGHDQVGEQWGDIFMFIDAPIGNFESVFDLLEGDHTETSVKLLIKKKGTATVLLDKDIGGSLLPADVTITTNEP